MVAAASIGAEVSSAMINSEVLVVDNTVPVLYGLVSLANGELRGLFPLCRKVLRCRTVAEIGMRRIRLPQCDRSTAANDGLRTENDG